MHSEKQATEVIGTRVPSWMPSALETIHKMYPREFDSRNAVQVAAFRQIIVERLGQFPEEAP